MNYRYRQAPASFQHPCKFPFPIALLMLAGALASLGFTAPAALAQSSSRGPTIDNATKTAAALSPAQQTVVTGFVAAQAKELSSAAVVNQQRGRDALSRESVAAGGASAAYQQAYAAALNAQLVPLAKSANVRARLNGAIALARVAKNVGPAAGALEPATLAFVGDSSEAVALWAIKAAQFVLPAVATGGKPTKLTGSIVGAAQKFGQAGDLTEDAYRALTLEGQKAVPPAAVPVVSADLLKLFEWRVDQYAKRTPPRPRLDARPVAFFVTRVWDSPAGKAAQPRIVQQFANLAGYASQHAVAREELATREPFVDQLRRVGDAMIALSTRPQLKAWAEPGKALTTISNSTPEGDYTDRVAAAFDAMKAVFPDLKPAPTIDEGAAVEAADEIVEADPAGAGPTGGGTAEKPGTGAGASPKTGAAGADGGGPAGGTTPPTRTPPPPAR